MSSDGHMIAFKAINRKYPSYPEKMLVWSYRPVEELIFWVVVSENWKQFVSNP